MKIRLGLVAAFLVIWGQWYSVAEFISHSYLLALKVGPSTISAAFDSIIVFSVGSLTAVVYSLWAHDRLLKQQSPWRFAAMLAGLAGLAGLLVFAGMFEIGYVVVRS